MYRIAQEALNNIAKHAQASTVTITVEHDAKHVTCSVKDDGVGFDQTASRVGNRGLGLLGIRERLTPLGGVLRIDPPRAGHGAPRSIPLGSVPRDILDAELGS